MMTATVPHRLPCLKLLIVLLTTIISVCSCRTENGEAAAVNLNLDTITLTYETVPVPDKIMTNLSRSDTTVYPGDTLLVELSAPKNIPASFRGKTSFELESDRHCIVKQKSKNSYYIYVTPSAEKWVIVSSFVRRPNTVFRFAMKDDYGKVIDYFYEQDLSCESKHAWPIDSAASAGK